MRSERRDGSAAGRGLDDGDLKKKIKIRAKKMKDQNVSFAREEWNRSLLKYGDLSILNLPGVEGMLSRWDICFSCDIWEFFFLFPIFDFRVRVCFQNKDSERPKGCCCLLLCFKLSCSCEQNGKWEPSSCFLEKWPDSLCLASL